MAQQSAGVAQVGEFAGSFGADVAELELADAGGQVFADLREAGESCGKHRLAGLMRTYKIKALRGYKAPRAIKGRPSIIAPNRLNRVFTVDTPNKAWVTDITYIRTWQGWLYLAVVLDLYARKVVGWSMKPT